MPASLVPSLLQAIVLVEGEALVMHAGERPYVVTDRGQVALANGPVGLATVNALIDDILNADAREALASSGAAQAMLEEHPLLPGERFSVVAARSGNDSWLEIRRETNALGQGIRSSRGPGSERAGDAPAHEPQTATVLPLTRSAIRGGAAPGPAPSPDPGLERLIRVAAARGASDLYLISGAKPAVRVDGTIEPLDGVGVFEPSAVEALLLSSIPERSAEALRRGSEPEWTVAVHGLGPVRCLAFRDHHGPGAVLRLMPARVASAEQLELATHVLPLVRDADGLLLVTGSRGSGKRTLLAALVDHLSRARRGHIVTIERDTSVVLRSSTSVVSQREVRNDAGTAAAVRAALREDPDVLVVHDLRGDAVVDVVLDAAEPGRLVIAGVPARSASAAIDAILDLTTPLRRERIQLALAQTLRGAIAQVLLRRIGGGRVAVREVLVNTPSISSLLAAGSTSQLPAAIEGGRAYGMVPLNDALAAVVRSHTVDPREALRCAVDKPGLLALLQQHGIDVATLERLG